MQTRTRRGILVAGSALAIAGAALAGTYTAGGGAKPTAGPVQAQRINDDEPSPSPSTADDPSTGDHPGGHDDGAFDFNMKVKSVAAGRVKVCVIEGDALKKCTGPIEPETTTNMRTRLESKKDFVQLAASRVDDEEFGSTVFVPNLKVPPCFLVGGQSSLVLSAVDCGSI